MAFPEILYNELQCRKCGHCEEACAVEAITLSAEEGVKIDRGSCTGCGDCVEACPNQALELVGYYVTDEELLQEAQKDSPFYRRSNGGVTVGGGEAVLQHEFVTRFLKRCKERYIHTAIETCGYTKWEHLAKLLQYVDLLYYDIKHMDPVAHRKLTGVSNERILENSGRASAICPTVIRIPIVPGYNDSDENLLATARFALESGENLKRIELLPYHNLGTQTYARLGREYALKDVETPGDDHMQRLKGIVESCGIGVQIGG